MNGRVDPHWDLVWIFACDALVHLEKIAVALPYDVCPEALNSVREIEENAQPGLSDSAPFIAHSFGIAGSHVARNQISETRILPLQVVISLVLGNVIGSALVALL